jgi:hypothetical protein
VLLDGLTAWMTRKGFRTLEDLRGKLAVLADNREADHERASYISALRAADLGSDPW